MWETAGDSEVESSRDSAPVPGAIVVGGAVIAKRLYDKRRAGSAQKAKPKA